MIEISLPIRLQSPNVKEHWTKTYKRNKRIAQAIGFTLRTNTDLARIAQKIGDGTWPWSKTKKPPIGLKIKITFVRVYASKLFDFDNLVYAFKAHRDQTCGFFFDLAPGQADCQKCFDIHYLQEKGGSGIKIILEFTGLT